METRLNSRHAADCGGRWNELWGWLLEPLAEDAENNESAEMENLQGLSRRSNSIPPCNGEVSK